MVVPITEEEIQAFHDRGYLVLRNVFNENDLNEMRAEADRILELLINSSLANDRMSGRLTLSEDETGIQHVKKVQPVNDLSLTISEISEDKQSISPIRTLMSDKPILLEEKLNYKQPLSESVPLKASHQSTAWPVHNDWAYYRQNGYPRSLIWSAVCLDDCTADNGPIHVWPGSHIRHLPHQDTDEGLVVPPDEINYKSGIDVTAAAGSVLLFHSQLVHNSWHNDSGRPRRLLLYSHYPKGEYQTYFDQRNGPVWYEESAWESEYRRKIWTGEFEDKFKVS